MRNSLSLVGIILIVVGILILVYKGYSYTKEETVAQIGDLQVTAATKENVYVHPLVGGLSIAAGLVLVVVGRRNRE